MLVITHQLYFLGIPISRPKILAPGKVIKIKKPAKYPVFWSDGMATQHTGKERINSARCLEGGLQIDYQTLSFAGIEGPNTERGEWQSLTSTIPIDTLAERGVFKAPGPFFLTHVFRTKETEEG